MLGGKVRSEVVKNLNLFFQVSLGFSPPSRAARERTKTREPPNQREAYDNSRVPADPEIMQFKELWVDSEELFRRDGLKGFIEVLKFDLDLEDYDRGKN